MSFSSIIFLFYFLPLTILVYSASPQRARNIVLLAASYVFYAWGSPTGAAILLAATIVDYFFGGRIRAANDPGRKKLLLGVSVSINVLILFYFKYANFFVGEANRALHALGMATVPWMAVIYPLGISFIVFHKIGYLVDIYYGKAEPAGRFADYALYLALFPKLLQGPIVRYNDLAGSIAGRSAGINDYFEGTVRFCVGLAKKVLIADVIGAVADRVFLLDGASLTPGYAWIGALCYTFQIYFDFSGYSDMAIGIGRIFGFTITENFDRPYISRSFTEFWRRWHMTLGAWFREYLYIPLGGNRAGSLATYRNLWIVFMVTGLWHGANWTFIAWGAYHGFFMFVERLTRGRLSARMPAAFNIALTFLLVNIGWVLFRSDTIGGALHIVGRMLDVSSFSMPAALPIGSIIGVKESFTALLAAALSFFPGTWLDAARNAAAARLGTAARTGLKIAAAAALFVVSLMSIVNSSFNPFIYFRF